MERLRVAQLIFSLTVGDWDDDKNDTKWRPEYLWRFATTEAKNEALRQADWLIANADGPTEFIL